MLIHRVEVEEGFLDGLDLTFSPHLNVLIGPRGSGKTSVVELIRYCLDASSASERSGKAAKEHALSVLGSGRVTVTIRERGREVRLSRSADDADPRVDGPFTRPLIFSQNEIESVGLEASGRLRILDGFKSSDGFLQAGHPIESGVVSGIRSMTAEIASLLRVLDAEEARISELEGAPDDLAEALSAQSELLKTLTDAKDQNSQLESLGSEAGRAAIRHKTISDALRSIQEWKTALTNAVSRVPEFPNWPTVAGSDDLLKDPRQKLEAHRKSLRGEVERVTTLLEELKRLLDRDTASRLAVEDAARGLRRELEQLREGAGAASLRVTAMQEQVAQLEAARGRRNELAYKLAALQHERTRMLQKLDAIRLERFSARKAAAKFANSQLGPTIEIRVERGGLDEGYANAIREGLRGSGLHYNTLAPEIAARLSPWELAETAETGDISLLTQALSISDVRAQRVLAELRTADLGKILSMPLEDNVTMFLLDGRDYKPTPALSTGQRCTVVLSALLAQVGPPLLVDQPEDHLDNAFIVHTLIDSVLRTKSARQLIFTTHNPNIPVLGEAEQVTLLGSDGRRGFVRSSAPIDAPTSVAAITAVMEGGADAFRRRVEFYRRFGDGRESQ